MNICFSGGAAGADELFGQAAEAAGHQVIHYHFGRPKAGDSASMHRLSEEQLREGDGALALANKTLKRRWPVSNPHVASLLRRNFWQIRDSERLYAAASIDENGLVSGGTAWAVEMFKNVQAKDCYVYDQNYDRGWYAWSYLLQAWVFQGGGIPAPDGKYTGIGSRVLNDRAVEAIWNLYV